MPKLLKVDGGNGQRDGALAQDRLAQLAVHGLQPGEELRFRFKENGTWIHGTVQDVNKDGSLTISAQGKQRAIMPERCQKKTRGPKGGTGWEDVT